MIPRVFRGATLRGFDTDSFPGSDDWVTDVAAYMRREARGAIEDAVSGPVFNRVLDQAYAVLPVIMDDIEADVRRRLPGLIDEAEAEIAHRAPGLVSAALAQASVGGVVQRAIPTKYKFLAGLVGAAAVGGLVFSFLAWRRRR